MHTLHSLKDCIWLFTASPGYRVVLRPLSFDIKKSNIFSIGNGHNSGNLSSLILTRYQESIAIAVVSESTQLWLKRVDIDAADLHPQFAFEIEQQAELGMRMTFFYAILLIFTI